MRHVPVTWPARGAAGACLEGVNERGREDWEVERGQRANGARHAADSLALRGRGGRRRRRLIRLAIGAQLGRTRVRRHPDHAIAAQDDIHACVQPCD